MLHRISEKIEEYRAERDRIPAASREYDQFVQGVIQGLRIAHNIIVEETNEKSATAEGGSVLAEAREMSAMQDKPEGS